MARRVLVCGGRDYDDAERLNEIFDASHSFNPISCLIHGAARGADQLAADWALSRDVLCLAYPADWAREGRAAGPIRNQKMIEFGKPDVVVAFPGGRGTADMIRRAEAARIPVVRISGGVVSSSQQAIKELMEVVSALGEIVRELDPGRTRQYEEIYDRLGRCRALLTHAAAFEG